MATRPAVVPADATLIYPGQTFGPGLGVQLATLLTIQAQLGMANAQASQRYAGALRDWIANAQIYQSYGLPIPPAPAKAVVRTLHVVYAAVNGEVVQPPGGADGLHFAWIWETQE